MNKNITLETNDQFKIAPQDLIDFVGAEMYPI